MPNDPFVYFDLGMVLVTFDHQIATNQLADLIQAPSEKVQASVFESGLQNEYETGLISDSEFASRIRSEFGSNSSDEEILESISAIFEFNEPIVEVLEFLRGKQIPMAILSNTCSAHWNWILKQGWPVPGDWFDYFVLSYEVQGMKPDTKIYEVCETRAGRNPGDLFFTDDKPENTQTAQSRGWSVNTFTNSKLLLSDLRNWLDR